ncbi:conserved hypothetical protein [Tenacibaculum dicentrarchi]|uniref:TIR domain-containing protein n=1 Tax=Tenacibaculum dicentrarchi TaxID=669041 RepID=A0ABM9NYA7_9FLAO|nr:hypothetical protein [Tenacibaculum dicentrarchi]SOS55019.1 conserved hypothetical protein [Tenacibaculum dicentrarchi]
MYRGFNLNFTLNDNESEEYEKQGKEIFNNFRKEIKNKIDSYSLNNGNLSANLIINDWFPNVKADIFLSHSHKDEKTAFIIAGWIYKKLGLTTFIDSAVWGYADNLIDALNYDYCYNEEKKTYDYRTSNNTCSHVNLMLLNSLNKMIDNCECIFFLNTPNSISSENFIKQSRTFSPWIYSEICTTQIIKKKTPKRLKSEYKMFSTEAQLNESKRSELLIEYDIDLSHLMDIDFESFRRWILGNNIYSLSPLDSLYKMFPIKNNQKYKQLY